MSRLTEDEISELYRRVASYSGLPDDRRRYFYLAIPVGIMLLALVCRSEPYLWLGGLALIAGAFIYFGPDLRIEGCRRHLAYIEGALAQWRALCEQTDPRNAIAVEVPLKPGETVFFSGHAERWVERLLGQKTAERTSGRMTTAVIGGVIAGPVGAIVGSAGSKRTTGSATNVYGLSPIDQGTLIITNQRMMFLGTRDTLSIPYSEIVRFSVANRHPQYRVTAEYAGRESGEQYGVDQEKFVTNMWRRANVQLGAPTPSAPLPEALPFHAISFDRATKALT